VARPAAGRPHDARQPQLRRAGARRDADALGDDPVAAYTDSVRACADAFAETGSLDRIVDYPLGELTGRRALAVRTADSVVHTWDLARALGADDTLDPGLVAWADAGYDDIFAGLAVTPSAGSRHRFFAGPPPGAAAASRQDRLLTRFGRDPRRPGSPAGPPAR
jgi:uncharacterized protein (TIGR03086 family)